MPGLTVGFRRFPGIESALGAPMSTSPTRVRFMPVTPPAYSAMV